MRNLDRRASAWGLPLLSSLLALACAPRAEAKIDSVSGCRPGASGPVAVYAGRTNSVTVRGFGVDLALRVEVRDVEGVTARLGARKPGTGSTIEVELTVSRSARHGDEGHVVLKYAAGLDAFPIKVVQGMTVTSISIENVGLSNGQFVLDLNRDYTLVFRANNAELYTAPSVLPGLAGNVSSAFLSRSGDTVRLRIRSGVSQGHTIEPQNLRGSGCDALQMVGSASARVFFRSDPFDRTLSVPGSLAPLPTRPPGP